MRGKLPSLPPAAEDEILERLFRDMEISSDEVAAILEKHGVLADENLLQHRYRKQLGQRLMAGIRDESGQREVMSNGKGRYFVLECCRDRQQLQSVRRRIQNQMRGLDASARKVQTRLHVLERLAARLKGGKHGG